MTNDPNTMTEQRALRALQRAHTKEEKLKRDLAAAQRDLVGAVADCRTVDVTWQDIADVLGMKQPNAHRRFSPFLRKTGAQRYEVVDFPTDDSDGSDEAAA